MSEASQPAQTAVKQHTTMLGSGIVTATIAGLGLFYVTIRSTEQRAFIPAGWTAMFAVGCTVGALAIFTSVMLNALEQHRADHATATLTVEDVQGIKKHLAALRRHLADVAAVVSQICMHLPADQQEVIRRDAQWLDDMAESLRIGREIELRRPQE